ncbi:MAG: putative inactive lipase [Acidimicrobiales bacterium]|nr:putative inactive lipase [Acidimicrobiales bacterium]
MLDYEPIEGPAAADSWKITYRSTSAAGEDIVSTGMLLVPEGDQADRGGVRPLVVWAHHTTGTADKCAPSRSGPNTIIGVNELLAAGWAVVAPDYEGLGTSSPHPYLESSSEAHTVLDAARAAVAVPPASLSPDAPVALWGFSQGGHAVLAAAEEAPHYAPELDLVGAAAAAPVTDVLSFAERGVTEADQVGVTVAVLLGHGDSVDLRLEDVFTDAVLGDLDVVETLCIDELVEHFAGDFEDFIHTSPSDVEAWANRLGQSRVGDTAVAVPVLVIQGQDDQIVDPGLTADYVSRACANGTTLEYQTRPGEGHGVDSTATVVNWIADRFAGAPAISTCG